MGKCHLDSSRSERGTAHLTDPSSPPSGVTCRSPNWALRTLLRSTSVVSAIVRPPNSTYSMIRGPAQRPVASAMAHSRSRAKPGCSSLLSAGAAAGALTMRMRSASALEGRPRRKRRALQNQRLKRELQQGRVGKMPRLGSPSHFDLLVVAVRLRNGSILMIGTCRLAIRIATSRFGFRGQHWRPVQD